MALLCCVGKPRAQGRMEVALQESSQRNTVALSKSPRAAVLLPSRGSDGPQASPGLPSSPRARAPCRNVAEHSCSLGPHAWKGAFSVPSKSELSFKDPGLLKGKG